MVDTFAYTKSHEFHGYDSEKDFDDDEPFKASDQGKDQTQDRSPYERWPSSIDNTQVDIPLEMLMILPPTIVGFDMQQEIWGQSAPDERFVYNSLQFDDS